MLIEKITSFFPIKKRVQQDVSLKEMEQDEELFLDDWKEEIEFPIPTEIESEFVEPSEEIELLCDIERKYKTFDIKELEKKIIDKHLEKLKLELCKEYYRPRYDKFEVSTSVISSTLTGFYSDRVNPLAREIEKRSNGQINFHKVDRMRVFSEYDVKILARVMELRKNKYKYKNLNAAIDATLKEIEAGLLSPEKGELVWTLK
ncbi:hypothetical protein ACQRXC_29525 (plasmid) [Niallia taxi]|uniref:hypothetical protein n=1 Tax=Niallia taxi TaxID=2499688 RepID=UPI003F5E572F